MVMWCGVWGLVTLHLLNKGSLLKRKSEALLFNLRRSHRVLRASGSPCAEYYTVLQCQPPQGVILHVLGIATGNAMWFGILSWQVIWQNQGEASVPGEVVVEGGLTKQMIAARRPQSFISAYGP